MFVFVLNTERGEHDFFVIDTIFDTFSLERRRRLR